VYGKPTSPDLPQASWFRAEDRPTVIAAAQSLKFSVLDIQTDAERALTLGVHEGVLKGNGRMIIGSVTPEVYKRIEDYAAKASAAPVSKAMNDEAAGAKPLSEQNANIGDNGAATTSTAKAARTAPDGKTEATTAASPGNTKPEPVPARDPWDAVRIGAYVIGKYWNEEGEANGWWLGIITDIDKKDFYIRWPDEPLKPALKIERKHVALLHPSYDVNREWDRKR
jgi:hypothetical protein